MRTRDWVQDSRGVWRGRVCPECLPARAGSDAVLCRAHLITTGSHDDMARAADYLDVLLPRTRRCVRSMTFDGPDRAPDGDAALVEALGWFAGWRAGTRYM